MKTCFIFLASLALCGCASSQHYVPPSTAAAGSSADAAKQLYWQLQQPRPNADEMPRYRRLTITLPAHTEDGVNYEPQTRTILIAE